MAGHKELSQFLSFAQEHPETPVVQKAARPEKLTLVTEYVACVLCMLWPAILKALMFHELLTFLSRHFLTCVPSAELFAKPT